jgi:hypothetical protein
MMDTEITQRRTGIDGGHFFRCFGSFRPVRSGTWLEKALEGQKHGESERVRAALEMCTPPAPHGLRSAHLTRTSAQTRSVPGAE